MKFRKKPVVIDAVQWTGANVDEVLGFTLGRASVRDESFQRDRPRVLIIETLEGDMRAEPQDWIICGVKGEFYPCKPDIFAATYEAADAVAPASAPSPWHEVQGLKLRISKLEDAAFHFQTCRLCRKQGDSVCPDGKRFAAYLRGEANIDGD